MFRDPTLLVVGAGASAEVGLPVGSDLTKRISGLMARGAPSNFRAPPFEDRGIQAAIGRAAQKKGGVNCGAHLASFGKAADAIISALPFAASIDNLLDARRDEDDVLLLGKIAIAQAILHEEKKSYFSSPGGSLPWDERLEKSWLFSLGRLLNTEVHVAAVDTIFTNLEIVCFNYDRCIENFLYLFLMRYYGLDTKVAARIVSKVNIIHPYGQVGWLPWQEGAPLAIEFGGVRSDIAAEDDLSVIADHIRTFTESTASGVVEQVHSAVQRAHTIMFLGFAYHPQNMRLLTPPRRGETRRVFYTAKGLSHTDQMLADDQILTLLQKQRWDTVAAGVFPGDLLVRMNREPDRCSDLFSNFQLQLSSGVDG